MKNIFIGILLLIPTFAEAQLSGTVDYKPLGISFTIPQGWIGTENEFGLILGHNTKAGFVLLMANEAGSMADIKAAANENLDEGNGTLLRPKGQIENISNNCIGRTYEGTMEWQAVNSYVAGLYNPHGMSVTIIALTSTAMYDDSYKKLALQIANSVNFYRAEVPQAVLDWRQKLPGRKLTAMDSSTSSSSSTVYDAEGNATTYNEGTYQSSKTSFSLCSSGYFYYYSSNSASFDTASASSMAQGSSNGDGKWQVISDAWGQALLVLRFNDGKVWEYKLSSEDGKTYLNGNRYYKTSGDMGPDCN